MNKGLEENETIRLLEQKKILILRYRFIGDTVLTTPFIKNVKTLFPESKIDILVSPNSGELVEGNPNINRVFYLDSTKTHKYEKNEETNSFKSLFSCANELRKEKYDLIFVLKRSFSSAFLAYLIGAKYRVGFNTELRSFFLTHKIVYDKSKHELNNFLDCLLPFTKNWKTYSPEIFPTENEKQKAKELIKSLDPYKPKILIHASSAHPYKAWSKRYFAELIDDLYEKYKSQFIFTGASIDKEIYTEIISKSKYRNKISYENLCGKTNIRECYAIYENLHMAICIDSGNAHLAAAAGIPTYVLFGPTRPDKWLPKGEKVYSIKLKQNLSCQPCDVKVKCTHLSCMKLLTPDYVMATVNNAFRN